MQGRDQSSFFVYKYPVAPTSLVERNSFLHWITFKPLCTKTEHICLHSISGSSDLFHWPACLSFHQYYNILINVVLCFVLFYFGSGFFNLKRSPDSPLTVQINLKTRTETCAIQPVNATDLKPSFLTFNLVLLHFFENISLLYFYIDVPKIDVQCFTTEILNLITPPTVLYT